MKAPLQRYAGGLQEDASSGCRERIGEAGDLGGIQRLGAGNPNDGRPKSWNKSAGLPRAVTRRTTADGKWSSASLEVNVRRKPQDRRIALLGAHGARSQSQHEIRGEPQRKRHRGL